MTSSRGLGGRSLGAERAAAAQQRLVQQVPTTAKVSELLPSPENARENLPNIESLAATIRSDGLTTALTVVPAAVYVQAYKQHAEEVTRSGRPYVVIHGHRRLAAAEMAGLDSVPIMLRTAVVSIRIAAMLENQAREPLTPIEEGQEYKLIMGEENLSQRALATRLSVSQTTISHRIALLDLIPEAQAAVVREHYEKGTGLKVKFAATVAVKLKPELQKAVAAGDLDVDDATRLARLPHDEQIWPPEEPEQHVATATESTPDAGLAQERTDGGAVIDARGLSQAEESKVIAGQSPADNSSGAASAPVPPQREEAATPPGEAGLGRSVPSDADGSGDADARVLPQAEGMKVIAGQSPEPKKAAVLEARGYIPITTAEAIAQEMLEKLTAEELHEVLSYLI